MKIKFFLPCYLPSPYHKYTLSNNNVGRRGESFAQQNLSFCTFLLMSGNYTLAEPAVLKCLSLYTSWKIQPCHHYTIQTAVFLRGQLYLATKKFTFDINPNVRRVSFMTICGSQSDVMAGHLHCNFSSISIRTAGYETL